VDLIEIAWDGVNLTDMAQDKDRWRTLVVWTNNPLKQTTF
jgi:hypothetical protein